MSIPSTLVRGPGKVGARSKVERSPERRFHSSAPSPPLRPSSPGARQIERPTSSRTAATSNHSGMHILVLTVLLSAVCAVGVPLRAPVVGPASFALRLKGFLQTSLSGREHALSFSPVGAMGPQGIAISPVTPVGLRKLSLRTKWTHYQRPRGRPALRSAGARDSLNTAGTCDLADWEDVRVRAPDVSDRETLLGLAKMAQQAYTNDTWSGELNQTLSFEGMGGIRGHVFASSLNETVVISLRGSMPPFLPGGGNATPRDKLNDNLLFSCCCARVSWSTSTVCGCFHPTAGPTGLRACGASCVQSALLDGSYYYRTATELYTNVTRLYPDSQIWLVGHSIGGVLASLMGMTYGLPSVTFEAPGDRLAARRLHLPVPGDVPTGEVDDMPIYHVYHTADPLALGQCIGQMSPCGQFGYALESHCHAGMAIVYDTVGKLGWAPSLLSHRMEVLTTDLLASDWDTRTQHTSTWARWLGALPNKRQGAVPSAHYEAVCVDCGAWEYGDTF